MAEKIERLVPDNSVIMEGLLSKQLTAKNFEAKEIVIHEALLAELEHNALLGKASGLIGLDELKNLRNITKVSFKGKRPTLMELRNATHREFDSLAVELAFEEDAVLITASKIQSQAAQAKGVRVLFIEPKEGEGKLKLESFFDKTTMSAHLKEGVKPFAKKGMPGKWDFIAIGNKELTQDDIKEISMEIISATGLRKDAFIEIEREGSTIIQLGPYRIVITRPPFSDGWEITAVKPIKRLNIADYKISEKLNQRIEQAEGILVAGPPGHGKTTFAQSLAEFYAGKEKIVKTVEAPRDLAVSDNITQYSLNHGDAAEIHDILLLSRPDYTIFDEMRNTADFELFADLRLSGIGFLGVLHATNPIDAIQRFIGRAELGVIPQIIDTVIFIRNGEIGKVLELKMTVKVPSGMTEADLARPVVVVSDFETGKPEYEIYTYGEETVVVPIQETKGSGSSPARELAARQIEREMQKYVSAVEARIINDNKAEVYIPEKEISKIIGKGGKKIAEIEKKIGISIDVRPVEGARKEQESVGFEIKERGNCLVFKTKYTGQPLDIFVEGNYILTSITSKKGEIKLNKKSEVGKNIVSTLDLGKQLELKVSST